MKEKFLQFMTSKQGRFGRVFAGIVILSLGLFVIRGTMGTIVSFIALIPMAGGVFDFCLASVMLGYPLGGAEIRRQLSGK